MRGSSWLRSIVVMSGAVMATVILLAGPAESRKKRTPTPTPTPTATPTATPEVKLWNFDQDKQHQIAQGWTAIEGDWEVLADPSAPSPPNVFGLGPGRLIKSVINGLDYSVFTVVSDPTEYADFTLEASFKAKKGYFDCSGGLIFRYTDPKNFYLLEAGCPSDYFVLHRMLGGKSETLRQTVIPIDQGVWYRLKVSAEGDRIICYSNGKMAFDVTDSRIKRGRIGLWARDDSEPMFDDIKLTLPLSTGGAAEGARPAAEAAPPGGGGAPPPLPEGGGGAPPPLPR